MWIELSWGEMISSVDLDQQNWEVNYVVASGFTGEEDDELVKDYWGECRFVTCIHK